MKSRLYAAQVAVLMSSILLCCFRPASASEINEFLDEFEQAIQQGHVEKMESLIHFESLIEEVVLRLEGLSYSDRENLKAGFLSNKRGAVNALLVSLSAASVKRLRIENSGNIIKALYRFDLGEQGYSYMEWFIKPNHRDGKLQIINYYSYSFGKSWSDMVRELLAFTQVSSSNLDEALLVLTGQRKIIDELFEAMGNYVKAGDPQPFFDAYDKSGEAVRSNASIVDFYYRVASETGDEGRYKTALENIAKYNGDDPKYAFVLIDHYVFLEQTELAMKTLNSFESSLGVKDSGVVFLKGNVQLMAGNHQLALTYYEEAKSIEPTLEDIYWSEASVYVEQQDYKSLVKLFKQLESTFGYLFSREDFLIEPYYGDFIKSPEFKSWL